MNYNTFLIRYGIDPKCFKNKELFPIKTDTGYLYYLEQETEIVRKCPKCNRTDLHIKAYYKSKMNITINANETSLNNFIITSFFDIFDRFLYF